MEQNHDKTHHDEDTNLDKAEDKSLAESIGEAVGHIWRAIKEPVTPPETQSAKTSDQSVDPQNTQHDKKKMNSVVDHEVTEEKRNGYTLRETTIREIEYDASADEDTPQ